MIGIFIVVLISVMSLITFFLFGADKRKAVHHWKRIPERTLLLLCALFGALGGLLAMLLFRHKTRKWKFRILVPVLGVVQLFIAVFLVYVSAYYYADPAAISAMQSDNSVRVEATDTGWRFDGPSEDTALIFYPGAKVEAKAYAPLLRRLAENGIDSFLVKMPFNLAIFGMNRAGEVLRDPSYSHYYIGGHSLGGAMAAGYAAKHGNAFDGVILLAAYPTGKMDENVLLLYGSEDKVVNMDKVNAAEELVAGSLTLDKIEGGNHAQFGSYGCQKGDGTAAISAEEQQVQTVDKIIGWNKELIR